MCYALSNTTNNICHNEHVTLHNNDKRKICDISQITKYTGCPRRNVKYFGRVFFVLNYTDITQNTYIQS